jgi:hypothetical protein
MTNNQDKYAIFKRIFGPGGNATTEWEYRYPLCKHCRFWADEELPGPKEGLCRRYPPALPGPRGFRWPVTSAENWCGEGKEL